MAALTDTLAGSILGRINVALTRASGNYTGKDVLSHEKDQSLADGSSTNQATGWFGDTFTATTGGITISLADSTDPLGSAGDSVPTEDPEGLKLRALMIENKDGTNFVDVGLGSNALTSWLTGTTPEVRIPAGGFLLVTFPAGLDAMNDGSDDEIKVTADTASVSVNISYLFG